MVIITNTAYPPESAPEMAKRFLKAPELPDFLTRHGPYFNASLSDGILGVSFFEVEETRLGEALDYIGNYFAGFFGVPGFRYEFKTFFSVHKALKMIGMG